MNRSRGEARLWSDTPPASIAPVPPSRREKAAQPEKSTHLMKPASDRAHTSNLGFRAVEGTRKQVGLWLSAAAAAVAVIASSGTARADLTIAKGDKWEV